MLKMYIFLLGFHLSKCTILKETSNVKSELVLLEWTPRLCLHFVLYDMRLVNTFIIAMYGVMNNSLLVPNLINCDAKLHEMQKN